MTYQHYSAEQKTKIVLEILRGEKELNEAAKEYNINPNLIRKWRTTFLEKASIYIEENTTEYELRACIDEYINQYNNLRPHEALDYATPASVFDAIFAICA